MAQDTRKDLRGKIMYSIFTRNYSPEGTFEAVRRDLDRIQALGTDIIWLMPIHPSGSAHRKGSVGSPYAIRDYRAVDPAQGTPEDFRRLTEDIHARGMKVIIDVVYHHTSPDSWLAQHHPEWFYHKPDGSFGNQVGDWWDVIDLDFNQKGLWQYLIDTLKMWAEYVDGFRCDVASMVPVDFWKAARKEVETVRPGAIWLAESVERSFVAWNRANGIYCASDSELYQAFDICYEYDDAGEREDYLKGKGSLEDYIRLLNLQEEIYPDNYDKLRFLENHDRTRAHTLIGDERRLRSWLAFLYCQKGTVLLYNGQEKGCTETPSLFDPDPVVWQGPGENGTDLDLTPFLQRLAGIKHDHIPANASFHADLLPGGVVLMSQTENGAAADADRQKGHRRKIIGVFALGQNPADAVLPDTIPDGALRNLLTGEEVCISGHVIPADNLPFIAEISQ